MRLDTRACYTSVLAFSSDSDRRIFQSWRICQKQLAVTRLMCGANARLVSISTPRHLTLHSGTIWWPFNTITAVFISTTCWRKPVQINSVLCAFSFSLFYVIQLLSSSMQEVIDFDSIVHSVTSHWNCRTGHWRTGHCRTGQWRTGQWQTDIDDCY